MKQQKHNQNTKKLFYLKTESLSSKTILLSPQRVNIKSIHFDYPYCNHAAGLIAIKLSPDNWLQESNHLSLYNGAVSLKLYFGHFGEDRHNQWPNFNLVLRAILSNEDKLSSEIELTNIIFRNISSVLSVFTTNIICDKKSHTLQIPNDLVEFFSASAIQGRVSVDIFTNS